MKVHGKCIIDKFSLQFENWKEAKRILIRMNNTTHASRFYYKHKWWK